MNDYSKLQELAKAATPGEWFVSSGGDMVVSHDSCETICTTDENLDMHDAKFIAAANPATVLELLAERDQLFGNSEQLKAENEALRKDAELGRVAIRYIDRLCDPAECDPLETIVEEYVTAFSAVMSNGGAQ